MGHRLSHELCESRPAGKIRQRTLRHVISEHFFILFFSSRFRAFVESWDDAYLHELSEGPAAGRLRREGLDARVHTADERLVDPESFRLCIDECAYFLGNFPGISREWKEEAPIVCRDRLA